MTHIKMHAHEADIDVSLVQKLISTQFPQWKALLLERVQSDGTDNAIYRLGTDMCIRLPRIPEAAEQIKKEQLWLPHLGSQLPLSIPKVLAKGTPQESYAWHWSIYQWIEGKTMINTSEINLYQAAQDLAHFIRALQDVDPMGGPHCRRGQPLAMQNVATRNAIAQLHDTIDTKIVTQLWDESLQISVWDKQAVWIHGDLLPANILVKDNRITAVIDFGLMGIGDPACDLIPAWSTFDRDTRDVFREVLATDDSTWMRGRGWALSIALTILPYYQHTNPGLAAIARRILNEILTDEK